MYNNWSTQPTAIKLVIEFKMLVMSNCCFWNSIKFVSVGTLKCNTSRQTERSVKCMHTNTDNDIKLPKFLKFCLT